MTVMAFECVEGKTLRQLKEMLAYWRSEYPGLDFFISTFNGRFHIIGRDRV